MDSSGHRHRRIRWVGALVAVPVVGYVLLLVSSVLGGPRVDTPLIPLPEAGRQQPAHRVTPSPERSTETPKPGEPQKTGQNTMRPVAETTSTATPATGEHASTPVPSTTPSAPPVVPTTTSPTTTPTTPGTTPSVTPGPPTKTPGHGKPTAPPGRTKTPNKP
ncbi:hypothetical protein [Kribbella sp. NPDC051620]|uniref:hypothetical protein n=1 Tax=Kribbella sp. NPDC051620 TaxID=3364120 RepID=UPI00379DD5F2